MHTHFSYQVMLMEAIAIVCAPQRMPDFGVFGLSSFGMRVLRNCALRGFHPHLEPGIYGAAEHVAMRDGQPAFRVTDLR